MPIYIDIYGLTKHRDPATINAFLDLYVDREMSEDRVNEELMMLSLNSSAPSDNVERYDWEPACTLSNIVKRGLDYPRRRFTVYLKPRRSDLDFIILSFTSDNQLILGFSIDDDDELPENITYAERLLRELAEQFSCHLGLFAVEEPPPVDEEEFIKVAGYHTTNSFTFSK